MNLNRPVQRAVVACLTLGLAPVLLPPAAASGTPADSDTATVVRIIDGDTIDVNRAGVSTRVRILQINSPELGGCLYDTATQFTAGHLPVGSTVGLVYDVARTDRFGRTLAFVTSPAGVDVSQALAEQGLGLPFFANPNRSRYAEMETAATTSRVAKRGLFNPRIACTPAHDLRAATKLRKAAAGTSVRTKVGYRRATRRLKAADRTIASVAAASYGLMSFWVDDVLRTERTVAYRQVRRVRVLKKQQRAAHVRTHR